MKKWWFIGGGNMAEAILAGALSKGVVAAGEVGVAEVREERRRELEAKYGVETGERAGEAEGYVLAVKPQQAAEALSGWTVGEESLLVSICAGLPTERLEGWCGARVVRVMPNLPATVGAGFSAYARGRRTREGDGGTVARLLGAVGEVREVEERMMDAVTGLSGSGPGFVFAFMEALEEAGVEQGLDRDTARAMAIATVRGAGELAAREAAKAGGADPAELRRRVSSKGGTTLAGLAAMEEKGFSAAARAAVAAATARSAELGKG